MTLLIVLVSVYLFLTGYLGYRGWKETKTAADYMLAGGDTHPVVMALSYGATFISTSAIIGFGGAAAVFGMSLHWLTFLNIFVGIFVAFVFFGARTRAMGHHLKAHTFPELLGRRYNSRGLQAFAGAIILFFMPIYTAAVLMGGTYIVASRLDINYETALFGLSMIVAVYVIMGGMKGVMYSDAMQGALMFFGLLTLLFLTYYKLGGITEAHEKLSALTPLAIENFGPSGHQGWTSMPAFGSKYWWIVMSQITFGVGIGVLAQPQLAVRFMTVKSSRELNRAVLVGALFILVTVGVSYFVGPLSNVFFMSVAPNGAEAPIGKIALMAVGGKTDEVIPQFMKLFMPGWLGDLFFVTLLAAAMSTLSSQFHAMGTAASRDLWQNLTGRTSEKQAIIATRIGIFATFLLSVTLALSLPKLFANHAGEAIIARGTAIFFGICAASFLPLLIGGLYTRFITKAGAIWGCIAGFAVSTVWLFFIKESETKALKPLTGIDSYAPQIKAFLGDLLPKWVLLPEVDPTVVALPCSILVTVLVSLVTRKYEAAHLDDCFCRINGKR